MYVMQKLWEPLETIEMESNKAFSHDLVFIIPITHKNLHILTKLLF